MREQNQLYQLMRLHANIYKSKTQDNITQRRLVVTIDIYHIFRTMVLHGPIPEPVPASKSPFIVQI